MMRPKRTQRSRSGMDNGQADVDDRMCWICLAGDEEQPRTDWVHPCRCRGTNKWVHEMCLSRWIDEKQKSSPEQPVVCTQCRTEYIIVMPRLCRFDTLLNTMDKSYERICPSAVMGMLVATLYFTAVTYGALTLFELAGYEEGVQYLYNDPTLLMILLPAVPTLLLLTRLIHWEDVVLRWLRRRNRNLLPATQMDEAGDPLPGAPLDDRYFEELEREHPNADSMQMNALGTEHLMRASCSFCVALSLPTFSVIFANTLYGNMKNRLLALFCGGITFVVTKGLATIYLRYSQYQRKRKRFVLNYSADNAALFRRRRRASPTR